MQLRRRFADLLGEFLGLFRQPGGLPVQAAKPVVPRKEVGRRFAQQRADLLNPPRQRREAVRGLGRGFQRLQRFRRQFQDVFKPVADRRIGDKLGRLFAQTLFERHEAAEQITAVHRRKINRRQRL